ncbi:MAG: GNAT family N-acetyltransferase [Anaerolineaceae bacterium]|nr:GNAT family N-acetyltransferase [Anaerolineaceae bacterium]
MVIVRSALKKDYESIANIIADTYSEFNLSHFSSEELPLFLGPFKYARSQEKIHQEALANVITSEMLYVADVDGEVVGVLRGRKDRLASLFVRGDHHRQGIGRKLIERFEAESRSLGVKRIKVSATLYGIPFYQAMGYKRSTGLRKSRSFDGYGLIVQPMRKVLD